MNVLGLISGGKDSCFNMMECVKYGHKIIALAHLCPQKKDIVELDSYMYQTIGHNVVKGIAECMELPLFTHKIIGTAKLQTLSYTKTKDDEVEDLYNLLKKAKDEMPNIQAVACGAILSNYQRIRVENVCERLGLVSLTYLWQREQKKLLREMIDNNMESIIVKTATMGMNGQQLGKTLKELEPMLLKLCDEYGCNPCGEGGEYETLTLDCPLFKKKLVINKYHLVGDINGDLAPVTHFVVDEFSVIEKNTNQFDEKVYNEENINYWNEMNVIYPLKLNELMILNKSNLLLNDWRTSLYVCHMEINENDDIYLKTIDLMNQMEIKLKNNELNFDNIWYCRIFLPNMNIYKDMNKAYSKYFHINPPSRSCITHKTNAIILECLADIHSKNKKVLHVQSHSTWAPANIGPYSQATSINGIIYLAGQIALDPATMSLDKYIDSKSQILQCIFNMNQVIVEMKSNIKQILTSIIYIANINTFDIIPIIKNYISIPYFIIECIALPRNAMVEIQCTSFENSLINYFKPKSYIIKNDFHDKFRIFVNAYEDTWASIIFIINTLNYELIFQEICHIITKLNLQSHHLQSAYLYSTNIITTTRDFPFSYNYVHVNSCLFVHSETICTKTDNLLHLIFCNNDELSIIN